MEDSLENLDNFSKGQVNILTLCRVLRCTSFSSVFTTGNDNTITFSLFVKTNIFHIILITQYGDITERNIITFIIEKKSYFLKMSGPTPPWCLPRISLPQSLNCLG